MDAGQLLIYLKSRGAKVIDAHIGSATDRATWTVDHDPTATDADKTFTATELANATDAAIQTAAKDALSADIDSNLLIQAVAQVDFEERQKLTVKTGQTLLTAAQTKARIKAIYRNLLG